MEEVFKLPALITHYLEHKERAADEDFNFLDFLTLHYLDTDHSTMEEHDLPLYKDQYSATFFIMPSIAEYNINISGLTNIKYNNILSPNYFYQYTGFLLQPPRSV